MKTFRLESKVVLNSGQVTMLQGHVSVAEIRQHFKEKYPDLIDSHGTPIMLRGRCAHLELDGYDSIKNFSFDEAGKELEVWQAD
jgi:hypothetical protein